jgi:hypothetical protein
MFSPTLTMGIAALRLSPATMPNPMRKKNHMQQARGDCPAAKEKALQQQSRIPCASHAAVGSRARLLQDQSRARRRRCRRGWGAAATVRVGEDGEEPRLCAPARVAETAGAASWRHPARICRGHRQLAALGKEEVVALTRVRHSARRCSISRSTCRWSSPALAPPPSGRPPPRPCPLHRSSGRRHPRRARKRRELDSGRHRPGLGRGEGGPPRPDLRLDRGRRWRRPRAAREEVAAPLLRALDAPPPRIGSAPRTGCSTAANWGGGGGQTGRGGSGPRGGNNGWCEEMKRREKSQEWAMAGRVLHFAANHADSAGAITVAAVAAFCTCTGVCRLRWSRSHTHCFAVRRRQFCRL